MSTVDKLERALALLRPSAKRIGRPLDMGDVTRVTVALHLGVGELEALLDILRGEGLFVETEASLPKTEPRATRNRTSDPVDCFFDAAHSREMVSREEERELARLSLYGREAKDARDAGALDFSTAERYIAAGEEARNRLVSVNLRLVPWVMRSLRIRRSEKSDILHEGVLGLMRAASDYDPERGARFSTYATWWIFQAVIRYLHEHSRLVRLPSHLSGAFAKLMRARQRLHAAGVTPGYEVEALAEELGMTEQKVALVLAAGAMTMSLSCQADEETNPLVELLIDESAEQPDRVPEMEELRSTIQQCLHILSDREQQVLMRRFGLDGAEPETLDELGSAMGITRERVRQIEHRALKRLRYRQHSHILEAFLEDVA
ncbi:MAG TPA: RNA polymerase sigma factor RpoD/SigA [Planctomycetota bacterium]|nr:RNA polymerase sigma factor RpoD/SigA [Planctomycetota bacterium]